MLVDESGAETGQKDLIQINWDDNLIRPLDPDTHIPIGHWTRISKDIIDVLPEYRLFCEDSE